MNSSTKIGLYTIIFIGLLLLAARFFGNPDQKPLVTVLGFSRDWNFNFTDSNLEPVIAKNLAEAEGTYAIVVEGLTNKERFNYHENEIFPAASLYKLFVLAAVLEEIEKGNLKETQEIGASMKHLDEILGGRDYGYEDFAEDDTIGWPIEEALTRVATVSDNYAALLLAEKVGWNKVTEQARKIGANSTTFKSPISTTASDIALFLRKLYQKDIVSLTVSDKIIELLSLARINNRIPAKLPKDLKIAHKTGELGEVRHDAGIVFLEGKPYLIVMMSKDVIYEDEAVETQAQISKDVYDYFTKPK